MPPIDIVEALRQANLIDRNAQAHPTALTPRRLDPRVGFYMDIINQLAWQVIEQQETIDALMPEVKLSADRKRLLELLRDHGYIVVTHNGEIADALRNVGVS